jgi:very-short-patch-repair endonuclease
MWTTLSLQTFGKELPLIPEFQIAGRKFRYDFCVAGTNVLIEVQGGVYARKRYGHSTGAGIERDCEKNRFAIVNGYVLFCYTSRQITEANLQELLTYVSTRYSDATV